LVPVFGIMSGILMLGERLNLQIFLGSIATIAGVAIIVLQRSERALPVTRPQMETKDVL
jgi:drug/metabolite transporter (DMT)-like permease